MDPPYYSSHQPEVQKLLGRMINMKVEGYTSQHGEGVLSIDTTDFIGSHLLLCQVEASGDLTPIMGYKSTKRSDCNRFGVDFPIERIVREHGTQKCFSELSALFSRCEKSNAEITYDTSWTISPTVRVQESLKKEIKDITTAIAVHHHRDFNIPHWLTFGICKFKTDMFFSKWGLKPVSSQALLKHPFLKGSDAITMHCDVSEHSQYAYEMADKYSALWSDRIHLLGDRWETAKISLAA